MIRIEGLSKSFVDKGGAVHALKEINLTIANGNIYGIIGLSGAGKSTLIRCINRLEEPTSGSIYIDGQDVTKLDNEQLNSLRRKIGMIFQHFNLLNRRSCYKNIAFPLEIAGYDKSTIDKRVDELLELVGLKDKKYSYPSQLSGGQKQRVAIARALAAKAEILLCDEATSALDPDTTKSILRLLKDINTELNITVVLITHQMEVVKEICNKVAVISEGGIVEQGNTFDIFSKPRHAVTKKFLKAEGTSPELIGIDKSKYTKLLNITFLEENAYQPIISDMVKSTNARVNIISGHISSVQGKPYGNLVIDLDGDALTIENALQYLKNNNLCFEEIDLSE